MGIERIKKELCTGCGCCVEDCPMDVLRMDEAGTADIVFPDDCMDCDTCMSSCPVGAVEVAPESKRKLWFSY